MTSFIDLILRSCLIIPTIWEIMVLDRRNPKNVRAVYLPIEHGLLPNQELENSPEVLVVHTFEDFPKVPTQNKVVSWIDKDALQLIDSNEPTVQGQQRVTYSLLVARPG